MFQKHRGGLCWWGYFMHAAVHGRSPAVLSTLFSIAIQVLATLSEMTTARYITLMRVAFGWVFTW
jgi:hypothetical protein